MFQWFHMQCHQQNNRTNLIPSCNKSDISKNYQICSNDFTCSVTNRRYYTRGILHCNCNNVIYLITCKSCLEQLELEYIKVISRPTKIDAGLQSILMISVKIIAIFFSFCLFRLLSKFMVMPQTLKKFYGTGKNIGKASYLLRLMA